jgi:hypothetical protein
MEQAPVGPGWQQPKDPGRKKSAWWRWPWLPVLLSIVAVVVTLWSLVPPGGYFGLGVIALFLWLATIVLWLAVGILAVVALPAPRLRGLVRLWPLLLVPALLAVVTVLAKTESVERVAFALHRPALERLVEETAQAPDSQLIRTSVGLYDISASYRDVSGCTRMIIRDAGFLNATGFAYCPEPPVSAYGEKYTQFDGPWYSLSIEW